MFNTHTGPAPTNDVDGIPTYAPGTEERERLLSELERIKGRPEEVPLIIGGREVKTSETVQVRCPHDHGLVLAEAHMAGEPEIEAAIDAALDAWSRWSETDLYTRTSVFKKAARMLAGPSRTKNTAAIMMNHSKNPYEAEIDLAELVDFWDHNAHYLEQIVSSQPNQAPGERNRLDWRPLEGFVLAVSPFNFYSIGGNLPTAPAVAGNVSLWKPATSVAFSNYEIMKVLTEAGLPRGVVNFVPFRSRHAHVALSHPKLAGVHFTGSSGTLQSIWGTVAGYLGGYRNLPRIVGEAGGKDFIFIHGSADLQGVARNIIRGGFGYQGQKCSAASRAYVPESMWPSLRKLLVSELAHVKTGPVDDLGNYMGAVIDEEAYNKVTGYISHARANPREYTIVYGGGSDDARGWFVEPTLIEAKNPKGRLMTEEIFGPVVTFYVYMDDEFEDTLRLCDETSPNALTGSIYAEDRGAVSLAERVLRYSAGNFYINDKPTGAVVGRQPFGGARASGTNDKAGSWLNVVRWLSPRTLKEALLPPVDWR